MPRPLLVAAMLVALALLGACSDGDSPDGGGTGSAVASEDEGTSQGAEVEQPLQRGLQAHVDGDLDGAVAAYEEVLEADPENKLALYNLGLVEQSRGNNEEAETYYRQTIEVDDRYTPALFNLAILRTAAGDHEEAVQLYEQVVEIDTKNAGAYLNMGFALREIGRQDDAQDAFNKAIELDPSMEDRITEG